jgi:hypothetical protein
MRVCRKYLYLIALLLAALQLPAASNAQDKPLKRKEVKELKEDVDPRIVFRRLEKAWKNSDAETIAALAAESRIFVDVEGVGAKGGYFSRSQLYFMLKKMFKNNKQTGFEIVKYHNLGTQGRRVFAVAARSYQNIRSDRVFQDKVYITLSREGPSWVMVEMKTTR